MRLAKRRGPKPAVLRVTVDAAEAVRRLVNAKPIRASGKRSSRSAKKRRHGKRDEAA